MACSIYQLMGRVWSCMSRSNSTISCQQQEHSQTAEQSCAGIHNSFGLAEIPRGLQDLPGDLEEREAV